MGGAALADGDFTTGQVYTIDKVPPTVLSIVRASPDSTAATTVTYTVTFSEIVTGVDTGDFTLATTGGVTGTSIVSVIGTGATRTVTVNTGTGAGTLQLNLVDNDTIKESAGGASQPLGGTGLGNGNFLGEVYIVL